MSVCAKVCEIYRDTRYCVKFKDWKTCELCRHGIRRCCIEACLIYDDCTLPDKNKSTKASYSECVNNLMVP